MTTRREFFKNAGILTGAMGCLSVVPPSIQRAMAIAPDKGTTFHDAEHVVFLMQENRSFDHCFGALQGVRGFNDPRAITLPNQSPVWLQSNRQGETYLPFRLNINDTRATWMGDLPHSWGDQVDARNNGKYDKWLVAKPPGNDQYKSMPLSMGHYTREDIPFYYALADAFTVCDQHFCSSLTGTTTNRLFFWTGKLRKNAQSQAMVRNSDVGYSRPVDWSTFPERLEQSGISWRVYQNELSYQSGLSGEAESLLANFTDNNLEWFSQYRVGFSRSRRIDLERQQSALSSSIQQLKLQLQKHSNSETEKEKLESQLNQEQDQLGKVTDELKKWSQENFDKLSELEKNLHQKGFTTNCNDPDFHKIETLEYDDGGVKRSVNVPKGDILHQFRRDVDQGNLPTVSWLVAPQKFSDHPSAPWYGAWYVSEVLDILTKNPEVWKKTIFILNYDENDGYFDHVPPFVAPDPADKRAASKSIDTAEEFVMLDDELNKYHVPPAAARQSPVGLGYRVPLVIASPWSRGGWVNSEVCDISSTLRFLEVFLTNKTGETIKETNISDWRRTVCGDLTSAFRPFQGEPTTFPKSVERNALIERVYNAKFKGLPEGFRPLRDSEIQRARQDVNQLPMMPEQEPGIRDSSPLNYELYADGRLNSQTGAIEIEFTAADGIFGQSALGSPFNVYAPGKYLQEASDGKLELQPVKTWPLAVQAGDSVVFDWPLDHFENKKYHLRVYGPNGFFREFMGDAQDPAVDLQCAYQRTGQSNKRPTGEVELSVTNRSKSENWKITITDQAYGNAPAALVVQPATTETIIVATSNSHGWYDFTVQVHGANQFERRYAGRVETGQPSKTDPLMGQAALL